MVDSGCGMGSYFLAAARPILSERVLNVGAGSRKGQWVFTVHCSLFTVFTHASRAARVPSFRCLAKVELGFFGGEAVQKDWAVPHRPRRLRRPLDKTTILAVPINALAFAVSIIPRQISATPGP